MSSQGSSEIQQTTSHPPAQPTYILRGHTAQIHAVRFLRRNTRIITGDADGWVIFWSISLKRPLAVWKAHSSTILGLAEWQEDKIITHGRDGRLCVWQLSEGENDLSTVLPVDDLESERRQPWLLHSVLVHALNFCSFVTCAAPADSIFVAVSGVQDGSIIVTALPSEQRVATIPQPRDVKTGMLMAVGLHVLRDDGLLVLAGYESGHAAAWKQVTGTSNWHTVYLEKAHDQPIMSLCVAHSMQAFFTSSADAIVARHSLGGRTDMLTTQTRHAGQQSLQVRSDERIFATAGWDGRARIYSTKTMKELAVLKWHKQGCYAIGFARVDQDDEQSITHMTVAQKRNAAAKTTHWLAVGSKDGKVSLWDVY